MKREWVKIPLASLCVFTLHFPSSPGTTLARHKVHIIGMIENMHNNCANWLPNWFIPQSGTDATDAAAPTGRADPMAQPPDISTLCETCPEAILSGGALEAPVPFMRVMTARPSRRTRRRIGIGQKPGSHGRLPRGGASLALYLPTSHFVASDPDRGCLKQPKSFE